MTSWSGMLAGWHRRYEARAGAMAKLKSSETYVAAARLGMQILADHAFATVSVMSFRYRESIVATSRVAPARSNETPSLGRWD